MKLYWTNKCIENGYRCPHCQLLVGNSNGQMSKDSKNHKLSLLDGQVKCVACNTTIGYFPRGKDADSLPVKFGWSAKILDTLDYVTAISQRDF